MNLRMLAAMAATFFVTLCWADIPAAQRAAAVSAATPAPPNASPSTGCNCHPLERDDLDAWLEGLLPYALKNGDIAGGVVSVVKDGSVLLQKGYGFADVGKHVAMDAAATLTRVGSTSKLFTWTAVMQLVEAGKLDLSRDVNDYLDFKIPTAAGKPITLLDLMNHRAGFEEGLKDILATDPRNLQSTETYLKRHPRPLLFPPGSVPAYSNYGAALAGYIVERVSGEPFEHYIEHHIFAPLGMSNSTFEQPLPERFKGHVALGYRTASTPSQPYELVVTAPAGSMATTAADMTRFMIAHLENGRLGDAQILSAQTIRLMHSPSESALPGFSTMAHGFFYESRNGRIVIGHGGDTVFFHTELDLLPEQHVGVFYSFNSRGRDEAVYALRKALWDGFLERYFPNASAATADAATVASASICRGRDRYTARARAQPVASGGRDSAIGASTEWRGEDRCRQRGSHLGPASGTSRSIGAAQPDDTAQRSRHSRGDGGRVADLMAGATLSREAVQRCHGAAAPKTAYARRRAGRSAVPRGMDGAALAGVEPVARGLLDSARSGGSHPAVLRPPRHCRRRSRHLQCVATPLVARLAAL